MATVCDMNATEKIFRWMDQQGMNGAEFCALAHWPKSFISMLKDGTRSLTLKQALRASQATGLSLDYLFDENTDWPPPPKNRVGVFLTDAEKRVLELAHEVSEVEGMPDPELRKARRRLVGNDDGHGKAVPPPPVEPMGPTYEDEKRSGRGGTGTGPGHRGGGQAPNRDRRRSSS
jgi:hypothetical protein